MTKRIHFSQQRPLNYIPIRVGLGLLPETVLVHPLSPVVKTQLAPKIYTTRTKPLKGEYVVIGGSRFKPFIIEPRVEFTVAKVWELNLRTARIKEHGYSDALWWEVGLLDQKDPLKPRYTFGELDLGIKGISFEEYTKVLLSLNKNVTLDTPFYVNLLKPLEVKQE